MATIKMTAKRQATFPAEVCREMGLASGDCIELFSVEHNDQKIWALKPVVKSQMPWVGTLNKYASKRNPPWSREDHGELAGRAMARESGQ